MFPTFSIQHLPHPILCPCHSEAIDSQFAVLLRLLKRTHGGFLLVVVLLHKAAVECRMGGLGVLFLPGIIGGGTFQLRAGGEGGMLIEEIVVHHGRDFLPMVAKQGLGLQQGHVHALPLAETRRHAQHAVNQAHGAVGQGVGQLLGTLHHASRLARGGVAGRQD